MKNPFKVGDRVCVTATHCSNCGKDGIVDAINGSEGEFVSIDFGINHLRQSGYHFSNVGFIEHIGIKEHEEKDESIWCIYKEKGDAPKRMYATYGVAKAELEKLAKANAGHRFYLLEAVEELIYEMKYERKELIYKTEEK